MKYKVLFKNGKDLTIENVKEITNFVQGCISFYNPEGEEIAYVNRDSIDCYIQIKESPKDFTLFNQAKEAINAFDFVGSYKPKDKGQPIVDLINSSASTIRI